MTSTDTLGRLHRVCTRQFPSCGGVAGFSLTGWLAAVLHPAIPLLWRGGRLQPDEVVGGGSAPGNSTPAEG